MKRRPGRFPSWWLLVGLLFWLAGTAAAWAEDVRVGVLSFRSLEQTRTQWQPTVAYLDAQVPGFRFELVPLFYPDLDQAVAESRVDFVFTNPEHFVLMRAQHGLAAIATLMPMAEGRPVNTFGGVVVTRADRDDLRELGDLAGKVVASPSPQSLGGYLMQRWALRKAGVEQENLKAIHFLGMPHDKSVQSVLKGEADAGFVRTGVLESMAREGKLDLGQVKVLNPQPPSTFPQRLSTDLYPEWPFAAMGQVPEPLVKAVALSLLSIPPDSPAAQAGQYYGFSPPGDYSPIEAIMLRLKVHPGRFEHFDWQDIARKYFAWVVGAMSLFLLATLLVIYRLLRDNRRIHAAREQVHALAFYDPLTQLANRRLLLDRLQHALGASTRSLNYGALLFIDLDDFKNLNDSLGHDMGDQLLREMGRRLETCVRKGDTVARLGGDEFVVMLENLHQQETEAAALAEAVAHKIQASTRKPYHLDGHERALTASIGVALFSDGDVSVEDLLKRADMAMYQAKSAGRDTLFFFDPGMQARVEARAALEADLRQAIQSRQFVLFYQLQVDAHGKPVGLEALLRWRHPSRAWVLPEHFIPLAEETGLIQAIGAWVLEAATSQLVAWRGHPLLSALPLAINLSARQFRNPGFMAALRAVLESRGIGGDRLKLELPENLFKEDVEEHIARMHALRDLGAHLALDGFGMGHSCLGYLKRMPLNELKINQAFVGRMLTDANDAAIAQTLIALGKTLNLEVVAEGVESEAQKNFLMAQGCTRFQGSLFGEPVPAEELERRLGQKTEALEPPERR